MAVRKITKELQRKTRYIKVINKVFKEKPTKTKETSKNIFI